MNQTANEAWIHSIANINALGDLTSPRGQKTKELLGTQVSFDMNHPICYHQDRKLSYKFMAAEAYWITSGSMFVDDIAPYNKHIAQFSDDGYIFNGAYGPKFINQLDYVVNCLSRDQNSRQAVMTIWVKNPIRTKDYACTLALQFLIRNDKLNTVVTMRSNDLWLGRPYDMFNFTIMTLRVLTMLNAGYAERFSKIIGLGNMYLNVGSAHLYEQHFDLAREVVMYEPNKETNPVPGIACVDWQFVVKSLLACRDMKEAVDDDGSNLWRIRP